MSFVYRCLAAENPKRPIVTRCKKSVANDNGILCVDHYAMCKRGPVNVLMNKEVTSKFRIPFSNQVCVKIDLSKTVTKPTSNTEQIERDRNARVRLQQAMRNYPLDKLQYIHDKLNMKIWDKRLLLANPSEFHKRIVSGIIETFQASSRT